MEEASSVAKAIEKGWTRAGKPQEFTVKVFEEAEKNFFGFTKKPAKIGLFFQEHTVAQQHRQSKDRQQNAPKKFTTQQATQQQQKSAPVRQNQSSQRAEHQGQRAAQESQMTQSPWSAELIDAAKEWINDSLRLMNITNASFTLEADRYALKITFKKPVLDSSDKEKMLFRSWAYLMMQAVRQKFKRPLKGLKVILTSNA